MAISDADYIYLDHIVWNNPFNSIESFSLNIFFMKMQLCSVARSKACLCVTEIAYSAKLVHFILRFSE